MVWGKLFGATASQLVRRSVVPALSDRFGPEWPDLWPDPAGAGRLRPGRGVVVSLVLIRRNTGNWRLDTFLCQVAGIGAAFSYYSYEFDPCL